MSFEIAPDVDWRLGETKVIAVKFSDKSYHFFEGLEKDLWFDLVAGKSPVEMQNSIAEKHRLNDTKAREICERQLAIWRASGLIQNG